MDAGGFAYVILFSSKNTTANPFACCLIFRLRLAFYDKLMIRVNSLEIPQDCDPKYERDYRHGINHAFPLLFRYPFHAEKLMIFFVLNSRGPRQQTPSQSH